MTAPHDLDRQLSAYLLDGPTELPDPSFDAVRDNIETMRQRVFVGPWRLPTMNKLVPIGLGAAAVVIALVVGTQLLGTPASGGVGGTPSAAPSATASPTAKPSVAIASPSTAAVGGIPEGPFVLTDGQRNELAKGLGLTVTISAPGWFGNPGEGTLVKNENADAPDGAGMIVFAGGDGWSVPKDPCNWVTTTPKTRSTTVDELVAALGAQGSRDASAPADITLGGHAGKSITLHVPDDAVFARCDQGKFCTLALQLNGTLDCYRYHQGPGQVDNLWIVDVNGELVVIDWGNYKGTPAEHIAELQAIVESVRFE